MKTLFPTQVLRRIIWIALALAVLLQQPSRLAGNPGDVPRPFHRLLWNGTVLSSNEWDQVAAMGFTLVHSYGGHPETFRQMLDEAAKRGIQMIGGAGYPASAPWLTIEVNPAAPGAPSDLWIHVVHHFTAPDPTMIFYGQGFPGLAEGLEVPLTGPAYDTLGKLAAYLNGLGGGIKATVLPGKETELSANLATAWYGNAVVSPVALQGSEFLFSEAQYRHYVNTVKDHPALYCLAPFDDPDIRPFSPHYQREVREKIRSWAPKVPVYLLVSDLGRSGGSFEHDHKIAPEAFDGFILYSYPHDWEGSGTYRDVDSLSWLLREWSVSPHPGLSREVIHVVAGFAQDNSPWTLPPENAIRMEWDAIRRSDVPLAGYGYYTWGGHTDNIGNSPFLRQEVTSVNALIASNHVTLTIGASARRIAADTAEVTFRADIRGGRPPFLLEWELGDGTRTWGNPIVHRFAGPGSYDVSLTALDADGRQFHQATQVHVLGVDTPLVERNFNGGSADGFVVHSGTWAASGGTYRQTDAGVPDARASFASAAGPQYTVEADFKLIGDRQRFSLLYSGTAEGSGYRVEVEPLQDAVYAKEGLTCRVWLTSDTGNRSAYITLRRNESHRISVDVLARDVLVRFDGQVLLEAPLFRLGGDGVVGFASQGSAAEFDNFRVLGRSPLQLRPVATQPDPSGFPKRFSFAPGVDGGLAPLVHHWEFGDGSISDEAAPTHDYASTGAYPVRLRVTDARGAVREATVVALADAQLFHREAEDYDWTDGAAPGHAVEAVAGQQYGAGQDGRRRVDFFQATTGQGDQAGWRDAGEVSMATDAVAGGVVIGWTSPGDWWKYTFDFPAAGMVRLRGHFSAERPAVCRVYWRERFVCDLRIPGKGWSEWGWVESPAFPVDGDPGFFRFEVLQGSPSGSLGFSRFELAFAAAPDADGDGTPDVADLDRDGDGYADADEATNAQSDPQNAASKPVDTDADRISNQNDDDDDGDGTPDVADPSPLVRNCPPVLPETGTWIVRAGELLAAEFEASDPDLPAQAILHALEGEVPAGLTLSPAGALNWTPSAAQAGVTYAITIRATDNGSPPLVSRRQYSIRVDAPLHEGLDAVTVATSDGPATVVVPRRHFSFVASNRTLHLATTGDDSNPGTTAQPWKTFAHSVNQLEPGDVLFVHAGEYAEPFRITRPGTPAKPIVISAHPGERVRITQPDGWIEANEHGSTIVMTECYHVWLHGLEIEGGWRRGTERSSGYDRSAIQVAQDGNRILNCLITRTHDNGVDVRWGACLVEGNVIWESGGHGIALNGASQGQSWVRGNVILRCNSGMNANFGQGAFLYNNTLLDSRAVGFAISVASGNVIAHNVIARSRRAGVSFGGDSKTNLLLNNVVLDSAPQHLLFDEYFGPVDASTLHNTFDHSVLDPTSSLATPAEWFTPWLGAHLIHADPQFLHADGNDFRLLPASPARDSAASVKLPGALPVPDAGLFPATHYWQPDLAPVGELSISEGEPFQLSLTLARPNPDSGPVTFELMGDRPAGMTLDPVTGALRWTPAENQAPGVHAVTVLTTADGSPLLTATTTLRFAVAEVNSAPVLAPIPDQRAVERQHFVLTPPVVDDDVPLNALAWSLGPDSPEGMLLDAATGRLTWTPGPAQRDQTFSVTVKVTDDGQPPRSASQTFSIYVDPANHAPVLGLAQGTTEHEPSATHEIRAPGAPFGEPGSMIANPDGTFDLTHFAGGLGANYNYVADHLYFADTEVTGDFDLRVRVVNLKPTSVYTFAGLMVRESLEPDGRFVMAMVSAKGETEDGGGLQGSNGTSMGERPTKGAMAVPLMEAVPNVNYPNAWLRLRRLGNAIIGYRSSNGSTWTELTRKTPSPPYPPRVRVGMVAAAAVGGDTTKFTVARFANLDLLHTLVVPLVDRTVDEDSTLTVQARATDTDLPAQKLTFALGANAPAGATIGSASGLFAWTPDESQGPGSYPVTVRVTDNGEPPLTAERTFQVSVNEVNAAPELPPIGDQNATEGVPLTLALAATDADLPKNMLHYTLGPGAPPALGLDPDTGFLSWTPDETDGGTSFPVTVVVTDNGEPPQSATRTFTVTVNEVNSAPALAAIGAKSVNEGEALNFSVSAGDPNDSPANAVTLSATDLPTGATFDPATGAFAWTPRETQQGEHQVTFTATDNGVPPLSVSETVAITVNEVNAAPELPPIGDQNATEGVPWTLALAATDADLPKNTLHYALGAGAQPALGLDSDTGVLSWTPGEADGGGSFPVTVVVTDNGTPPLTATRTFNLTVAEQNTTPTLVEIADVPVNEGTEAKFTAVGSDTDLPVQPLAYSLEPGAPAAAKIDSSTGTFRWTPGEADGPGAYAITVRVTDNGVPLQSATRTFTVTVNEVNTAPELPPIGEQNATEGVRWTLALAATDADLPKNTLHYSLGGGAPPALGLDADTGVLTWTPGEADGGGSFLVTAMVTDNGTPPLTATRTFNLAVAEQNATPVLTTVGSMSVNEGTALAFTVSAGDPNDTPANAVTLSVTGLPSGATFNPATGAFAWTPGETQQGEHSISFTATDNGVPPLPVSEVVTITVAEVNTAPVLDPIEDRKVDAGQKLEFTAKATDVDEPANAIRYALGDGAPAGAAINALSGLFQWTPDAGSPSGTHRITVRATDDGKPELSDSQEFAVEVTEVVRVIELTGLSLTAEGVVSFRWAAQAGRSYRVQVRDELGGSEWQSLLSPVVVEGGVARFTEATSSLGNRFYRVLVE